MSIRDSADKDGTIMANVRPWTAETVNDAERSLLNFIATHSVGAMPWGSWIEKAGGCSGADLLAALELFRIGGMANVFLVRADGSEHRFWPNSSINGYEKLLTAPFMIKLTRTEP